MHEVAAAKLAEILDESPPAGNGAPPRRALRICMIHYSHFPLDSRVQRHAYALAERGDEIDAICLSEAREIRVGPGVIRLHQVGKEKRRTSARAQLRGYSEFCWKSARRLQALQRSAPFDLVEAHNMPNAVTLSALGARLKGTPVILDVHDTFPELFEIRFGAKAAPLLPLVRLEEKLSAAAASAMICVTDEARTRLASRGVSPEESHVIMNSPDEGVFGPPRPPVSIPRTGPVRVVYHGGIAPRFGVETLIGAFELLHDSEERVRLDVHGAFEDFYELAPLCREIAPKRVFIAQSPTPFREIPGVLAEKHIGIVPTHLDRFTELLLPVKLLEYIHMGIPVVTSRIPAIENYFSDREVRFVEPGSAEALAEAVRELCAQPEAAARRAARASERLADIAWTRQREEYLALVDGMTAARVRRG